MSAFLHGGCSFWNLGSCCKSRSSDLCARALACQAAQRAPSRLARRAAPSSASAAALRRCVAQGATGIRSSRSGSPPLCYSCAGRPAAGCQPEGAGSGRSGACAPGGERVFLLREVEECVQRALQDVAARVLRLARDVAHHGRQRQQNAHACTQRQPVSETQQNNSQRAPNTHPRCLPAPAAPHALSRRETPAAPRRRSCLRVQHVNS